MTKTIWLLTHLSVLFVAGLATYALASLASAQQVDFPGKSQDVVPVKPMTDEEIARLFQPGDPWDGIGKDISQAEAEAFNEYPLYWFGPEIDGYNLQTILHMKYTAPEGAQPPSMDRFTFIYGRCTSDQGQNRCAAPVYIHVQPVCAVTPEMTARMQGSSTEILPSGATVKRYNDGHVLIWSDRVSIDIGIINHTVNDSDLSKLQRLGEKVSTSLAPANFSGC